MVGMSLQKIQKRSFCGMLKFFIYEYNKLYYNRV